MPWGTAGTQPGLTVHFLLLSLWTTTTLSKNEKNRPSWQQFLRLLVSFDAVESFSDQRCNFQRRNKSLTKRNLSSVSGFSESIVPLGALASHGWCFNSQFGGFQHASSPNGSASGVFNFDHILLRLSCFLLIFSRAVRKFCYLVHATTRPRSSEEINDWYRMYNWLSTTKNARKRQVS